MEKTLESYKSVYNMLEDSQSKDIYIKRLNYLLTGDFKYIRDIVSTYTPQLIPWHDKRFSNLLASIPKDRNFVLYGAGADAETLLRFCVADQRFIGFCSNNKTKQEKGYLGQPVMSPEELLSRGNLSVIISTSRARTEILSWLESGGYPSDLIFDGPAFYSRYIVDTEQYFNPEFMTFSEEETFIDAGSCALETALKLKKYCGHIKKVYAFEPDPVNYAACMKTKERFQFTQAEIIPFGVWSKKTTLHFKVNVGGTSKVCESGVQGQDRATDTTPGPEQIIEVPVMPIDDAVKDSDRVTMIKMDIEGSELEALKGARKTILRDKPKLAICIYHKPEDMVTIPLFIRGLVPEYKLYVRHHASDQTETVLYAVMPQ